MQQPSLLEHIANLARDARTEHARREALCALDDQWSIVATRPATAEDAETCRLGGVLASQVGERSLARVWRSRALTRSVASGWHAGVASLLLSEALIELARSNNDYPEGGYLDVLQPSDAALQIIDEMETIAPAPDGEIVLGYGAPTARVIQRFIHENRGLFLLIAGRFEESKASYTRAVEAAGDNERGRIKSLLGVALVDYVSALRAGNAGSSSPTQELADKSESAGFNDLVEWGRHNASEMERGGLRLVPYAIL